MLEKYNSHINQNLSFLKKGKLLIAISGGIDSVVLTHLCHDLKLNITLAHCNFRLRGSESDRDEKFVIDLGNQLNIEVFTQHFDTDTYAKANKLSTQMAARELRYNWFEELSKLLNFDYVLTAHHADDNLETVLINFTRGTGLKGLTGIPSINGLFVRPFLPFSREAIETYANEMHIKWRDDSSNASKKYLRNKLRHDVVPVLKEINPQLLDSFQNTIQFLSDTEDILEDRIRVFKEKTIVVINEDQTKYRISEFNKVSNPKAYMYEIFKDFGFTEWTDVLNLLHAQSGKQVFSDTHRLLKDRDYLILTTKSHSEHSNLSIIISNTEKQIQTPIGTLFFDETDTITDTSENIVHIDRKLLKFPLEMRRWKSGDWFFPLGMKGKKKVSKYLKDEKLSLVEKENIWLLTSNDDIVWVVGMRCDDRFKVTDKTTHIFKITLTGTSSIG